MILFVFPSHGKAINTNCRGTCNFSRIDNAQLFSNNSFLLGDLKYQRESEQDETHTYEGVIFAVNYNVLRIGDVGYGWVTLILTNLYFIFNLICKQKQKIICLIPLYFFLN